MFNKNDRKEFYINSPECQCWHEVGYSIAALESKCRLVSIKLVNNTSLPYKDLDKTSKTIK